MKARSFDILLFGATGFTGGLVAEYLVRHAAPGTRLCLAGRSEKKLAAVRQALGRPELPIRVVDAHDEAGLDALVPEARVVCSTVGPFAQHGAALARAAARHGTHYCDSTGEPTFVRRSIDENHEVAAKAGSKLVHACGFDAIPFDLGVHMLWDHAHRTKRTGLRWAKGFAGRTKGTFSGGTVASIVTLLDEASRDASVRRLLRDPHGLDPAGADGPRSTDPFERDRFGVRWDEDLHAWTAPFMMSALNTRVVRRSHALRPGGYGAGFRYQEAMSFPGSPKGLALASAVTLGLGVGSAALMLPPVRKLVGARFGRSGTGPTREEREAGHFEVRLLAEAEDGTRISGRVAGDMDPGYAETAKMVAESALCLAEDAEALAGFAQGGVLTPATAMGMVLVERLRRASMTFTVESQLS